MLKSIFAACLLFFSLSAIGKTLTSAAITTQTLKALPHCLQYKIRGFCTWFSPLESFNVTPYLSHYSPDLVVTVFNKVGDNPWIEIKNTIDQAGKIIEENIIKNMTQNDAGSGQHSLSNEHEQHVYFKEADVVGNPALLVLPKEILLPTTAIPLKPYFQSMVDTLLWRGLTKLSLLEESASVVTDLKYHVGSFPIDWGGLFPHEGFLTGNDDAIVSVVIALRAAHLLTLPTTLTFSHLVEKLSTQCGEECNASPIEANNDNTQFQRIYPLPETSCHVVGSNLMNEVDSESDNQAYAWIVWRKYQGCVDGDGDFVTKVIF